MYQFSANYYSGDASANESIIVIVDANGIVFDQEYNKICKVNDLKIRPRVGNTQRKLQLPNNGLLETSDNDVVDQISQHWGLKNPEHLAFHLETRTSFVLYCFIAIILFGLIGYFYGLPWLAKKATEQIPYSIDEIIAEQVIPQLENQFFSTSELDLEVQQSIRMRFKELINEVSLYTQKPPRDYKLAFRKSDFFGANALALPDGTVVVLDGLINKLESEHQLDSILLHEIAHIYHRHTMQLIVRHSGIAAFLFVFTGDVTFSAGLATSLPLILAQKHYSREFENEADSFSLDLMLHLNIPPIVFAEAMALITTEDERKFEGHQHNSETDQQGRAQWIEVFSTHPATDLRIQRFEDAQKALDSSALR